MAKVLQTLGKHRRSSEGIFTYKRTSQHVVVEPTSEEFGGMTISNEHWSNLLEALEVGRYRAYRLTRGSDASGPPSIYELINTHIPEAQGDSHISYIAAILEHEGSVDFYHGRIRGGGSVYIPLCSDISSTTTSDDADDTDDSGEEE